MARYISQKPDSWPYKVHTSYFRSCKVNFIKGAKLPIRPSCSLTAYQYFCPVVLSRDPVITSVTNSDYTERLKLVFTPPLCQP